jgi:hypothetical protein
MLLAIARGISNSNRVWSGVELQVEPSKIPRLGSTPFTAVTLYVVGISPSTSAILVDVAGKARAWCHIRRVRPRSAGSVKRIAAKRCSKARSLDI